jgi:predicted transglutaminase-like protease
MNYSEMVTDRNKEVKAGKKVITIQGNLPLGVYSLKFADKNGDFIISKGQYKDAEGVDTVFYTVLSNITASDTSKTYNNVNCSVDTLTETLLQDKENVSKTFDARVSQGKKRTFLEMVHN